MTRGSARTLLAAGVLILATSAPAGAGIEESPTATVEGPVHALESSIPGLYGVNELATGLSVPVGMDLDPDTGMLWATVSSADEVVAFDHAGNRATAIDVSGNGTGQIDAPTDVAIVDGEAFVAEGNNHRVQVFDTSGNHLRMWGTAGSGAGQFDFPCGIEVVGNAVYVSDKSDRVQVFNKDNGSYVTEFGSTGSGDGQLSLSCFGAQLTHYNGEIFVVDSDNDRVSVFDTNGTWQRHIGAGTFSDASTIDADASGTIWVADFTANEVTLWSPVGALIDSFGATGTTLGTLNGTRGIVVDPTGHTVWLAESPNQRIQPFSILLCAGQTLTHVATSYDDTLTLTDGDDVVRMGAGKDVANGGAGDDLICGGDGNDILRGGPGEDTLRGEKGNDKLYGGGLADDIDGGPGKDTLWGGNGPDLLDGNAGNDTQYGQKGGDTLIGDAGGDTLRGGDGPDTMNGNGGDDDLAGGKGNDGLNGGNGTDVCKGNQGIDTATKCETVLGVP